MKIIDAHIHLDHYQDAEIEKLMADSAFIDAMLSVSFHLESCKRNLQLKEKYEKVKPAFGYHPEQVLPDEKELEELLAWLKQHHADMFAIGEVGLPYYLKRKQQVSAKQYEQYQELLERFIRLAKAWDMPLSLHAIYDDAPVVCDMLEKHSVTKAHFHWFKGDKKTIGRMAANGYYISVTPDIVYEEEIQHLVEAYPLKQIMVETDGPWPFEGPFSGKMTHPNLIKDSIAVIAKIKQLPADEVAEKIYQNTKKFFQL